MMKAEAKWSMPGTLKWPESVKKCFCLPLFHAEGDEQIHWRLELHLQRGLFSSPEADPDQLRAKLYFDPSSPRLRKIAANFSIFVYDDKEDRVVFQHSMHRHKIISASPSFTDDLAENLELGKSGQLLKLSEASNVLVKLSQVSIRCIVEYYNDIAEFQRISAASSSNNPTTSSSNSTPPSVGEAFRNSSLSQDLKKIFTDDHSTSDICFVVKDQEIKAHKSIVSARSPVFAAMFSADMKETLTHRVDIQGIEANIFKSLLLFLYTDQVQLTKYNGADLLAAANQYSIPLLKARCEEYLYSQNLTTENCAERLILADLHNAPHLKRKAEDFIRLGRHKEVMKTEGWKKLKQSHPDLAFQVLENILGPQL